MEKGAVGEKEICREGHPNPNIQAFEKFQIPKVEEAMVIHF
jgi:hypothetical protein